VTATAWWRRRLALVLCATCEWHERQAQREFALAKRLAPAEFADLADELDVIRGAQAPPDYPMDDPPRRNW
jgi:hypothetical protein